MKDAYIIGAGGFAKEVLLILNRLSNYNFKGFIAYQPEKDVLTTGLREYKVFDETDFLNSTAPSNTVALFIGIGDPKTLKKVTEKFQKYDFPNLISPCVEIDKSVSFEQGNIITKGVNFTVDIAVGSFNIFNLNMTIGHDTKIGNFNVMNPGVTISGGVTIGDCNLIGTGATILQNLSIGMNNIIGGNGLLSKNVPDNKVMVGVPCKELIK